MSEQSNSTKEIHFCLRRYTNPLDKTICPHCKSKSFKPYVDEAGQPISAYFEGTQFEEQAKEVGRCDHERTCGYHYSVKDFFRDTKAGHLRHDSDWTPPPPPEEAPPLKRELVTKSMSPNSSLWQYWRNVVHLPELRMNEVGRDYMVGATKAGRIIYWMIDLAGKVKDGKMMAYMENGHRDKAQHPQWAWKTILNTTLKDSPQKSRYQNMVVKRPYFGTHLLNDTRYLRKPVAIVEGEKSALIGAILLPSCIWIAIGTKMFALDRLKPAIEQKRRLYFFPDKDGIEEWRDRLKRLNVPNAKLMDDIITNLAQEENDDIGDILIREYCLFNATEHEQNVEATLDYCKKLQLPELDELIRRLNLYGTNNP